MNESEIVAMIAQFGAAGLVAWMWLTERRTSAQRESQLTAAHDRILAQKAELEVLVRALESNTRAITALEVGQRHVLDLVAVVLHPREAPPDGTAEARGRSASNS